MLKAALLASCVIPAAAHASTQYSRNVDSGGVASDPAPPIHTAAQTSQVNLNTGQLGIFDTYVTIGDPSQGGLSWTYYAGLTQDNFYGAVNVSGSQFTVSFGTQSLLFNNSGGTFTSALGDGASLTQASGIYTLTMRDGTIAHLSTQWSASNTTQAVARVTDVTDPTGVVTTYAYKAYTFAEGSNSLTGVRLQGVSNNLGYAMKFTYQTTGGGVTDGTLSQVQGINEAVEYCNISADSCSLSNNWPKATLTATTGEVSVTGPTGLVTTYPVPAPNTSRTLSRPGGPTETFTFDSADRVISIANGVGTWTYTYTINGDTETTKVTDPLSHYQSIVSSLSTGIVSSKTDGALQTTNYQHDGLGRLTRVTLPEGGSTTYTYDGRGNVTQTQSTPKPGSTLPVRTTTAGFDATCTYPAKCNKPNWTKDALNNQTDYTYDNTTGLMTHLTPPGGNNGMRSDTTYNYGQITPYYKNSSGSLVAGSPVWMLGSTVNCSTATTCPNGSASASVVNYGYGYGNPPGTANNLLLTITSQSDGGGSNYRQRTFTYDNVGNLQTATDWLGNVTRYLYYPDRQLGGVIGPDPDGSGALKNRATRYTYVNSRLTEVAQGTTASQSDADWLNFAPLAVQSFSYDGLGRKNQANIGQVGSPAASITQYAYDGADRLICTAVRMNIGAALPSPCQLGATGAYGQDRITYLAYDAADRLTSTTTGYQTAVQRTEATTTYTPDGLAQTQADAKGNLTTFTYDGFDRLSQINFPTASNGSVSNGSDVINYTYDANDNLTGRRNRDTSTITYAYDGADRLTSRTGTTLGAISFTYDNLGRVASATGGGQTLTYVYDVLGRKLSEAGPLGTVTNQYDANDNRTRLQWPDGTFATYTYDASGDMTSVVDQYTQIAYHTYDDLGRRTAVYHANAANNAWITCSGYGYGTDLGLSVINIYGSCGGSITQSYGYWYNAAGQMRSSTSSNSAFDWTSALGNIGRSYATDGLNHYTTSGGVALSYDGLSNVINDTRLGYTYDGLNKLVHVSNNAAFTYDGLDRLLTTSGSATTRFIYEGDTIIGEYDAGGNVLRRYVPGADEDEFAAWYEAPGAGGYAGRRYYATDRQGSVVAVYSDAGAQVAINTYDESGVPGTGNAGRFSFNGAPYIPEADLLHMRARDYSFRLGRFMQTDPIGYGDGMNWYNYTHGDPVNLWDPSGLAPCGGPYGGWDYEAVGDNCGGSSLLPGLFPGGGGGGGGQFGPGGGGGAAPRPQPKTASPQNKPFHLLPSKEYEKCLGDAVRGDGTILGNLLAGAGLVGAGSPILQKAGVGFGGGGPSGVMTSPLSLLFRSIPGFQTSAGPGLRSVGAAFSPGASRSASVAGNLGRISSRSAGILGIALLLDSVDKFAAASKACEASVGR